MSEIPITICKIPKSKTDQLVTDILKRISDDREQLTEANKIQNFDENDVINLALNEKFFKDIDMKDLVIKLEYKLNEDRNKNWKPIKVILKLYGSTMK